MESMSRLYFQWLTEHQMVLSLRGWHRCTLIFFTFSNATFWFHFRFGENMLALAVLWVSVHLVSGFKKRLTFQGTINLNVFIRWALKELLPSSGPNSPLPWEMPRMLWILWIIPYVNDSLLLPVNTKRARPKLPPQSPVRLQRGFILLLQRRYLLFVQQWKYLHCWNSRKCLWKEK